MLAVLLALYELIVLVPDRPWRMAVEIIPLVIGVGVFRILKQNPFQIATKLRLEGE